jgi:hypothetical protein
VQNPRDPLGDLIPAGETGTPASPVSPTRRDHRAFRVDRADPSKVGRRRSPSGGLAWGHCLDGGPGELDGRVDTDHPGVGRSFQAPLPVWPDLWSPCRPHRGSAERRMPMTSGFR